MDLNVSDEDVQAALGLADRMRAWLDQDAVTAPGVARFGDNRDRLAMEMTALVLLIAEGLVEVSNNPQHLADGILMYSKLLGASVVGVLGGSIKRPEASS
jgi:hypothetical protein